MELGHPGQLLEGDAHQRIGVLVLTTVGGDAEGQGAGGLEPAVRRSRSRPDDLEQITEETPHGVVGVAGTEHAHPRMLGGRAERDVHDLAARALLDRHGDGRARGQHVERVPAVRPWCAPAACSRRRSPGLAGAGRRPARWRPPAPPWRPCRPGRRSPRPRAIRAPRGSWSGGRRPPRRRAGWGGTWPGSRHRGGLVEDAHDRPAGVQQRVTRRRLGSRSGWR